ncbi:polymorphic toxin type 22 domain-containing protein, partial [Massilia pseudoviolaceinigra]|uniref:polymorphic toxin type 22 domain-containing protein n=1 Tax=Massilia pseudoviolaceinigra TaxID=3057165 RepID=UPI002796DA05
GRYIQSDPIGLRGGINTYGYVGGNPLSLVDPLGLADRTPDFSITGANNPVRQIWDAAANYAPKITPDYVSGSVNVYVATGGFAINLHDGTTFYQGGLTRNYPAYSKKPGFCLLAGNIYGGGDADSTNSYLGGGGVQSTAIFPAGNPWVGVGGGFGHAYGGATAVEYGVGTPGFSVSPVTYGKKKP